MKKILLSLVMLTALFAFVVTQAQAANPADIAVTVTLTLADLSVSVSPDSWEPTGVGTTVTSGTITATNDSSNHTEALAIVCTDPDTTGWSIGSAIGSETYVMTATGGLLTGASLDVSKELQTGLVPGGTVTFTLTFTAPTFTITLSDSMTVTVTAS